MKRFITVLMLVLVAAAMPVLAQERVDSKIRFNDLYGEVSIRPDAEEDDAYEFAELDTIIYEDDRIRTKEESGAILGLEDMSTFVIKPESILIIHSEEENETKMEMLAGRIIGNVKKMAEGKTMGFEMSQCVAGIKGTAFKLTQSADGNTNKVEVIRGMISVNTKSGGQVYAVNAGQSITIKKDDKSVKVVTDTIDIEKSKEELLDALDKMYKGMSEENLLNELNEKSSSIKESLKEFSDKYDECRNELNNLSTDFLMAEYKNLKQSIGNLNLAVARFSGEIEETESCINTATSRDFANTRSDIRKAIDNAVSSLKAQCSEYKLLALNVKSLGIELENKNPEKTAAENKIEVVEELIGKFKDIGSRVDEIINDNPDNSSYDSFKEAANKCREYLEDLIELHSSITDFANDGGSQTDVNKLKSEYDSTYKKVQDAITRFSSVPEITNDVIKNMNDIEKLIPDYASKVREYLAEYNAIDKSSVDAKKRYVTAVSKLLVSYDRTKRQYTKANRMYQQVEKDFRKSSFKTSEYNDIAESWDRIESAMTELDNESTELSSCVDAIKSQLDDLLGQ